MKISAVCNNCPPDRVIKWSLPNLLLTSYRHFGWHLFKNRELLCKKAWWHGARRCQRVFLFHPKKSGKKKTLFKFSALFSRGRFRQKKEENFNTIGLPPDYEAILLWKGVRGDLFGHLKLITTDIWNCGTWVTLKFITTSIRTLVQTNSSRQAMIIKCKTAITNSSLGSTKKIRVRFSPKL